MEKRVPLTEDERKLLIRMIEGRGNDLDKYITNHPNTSREQQLENKQLDIIYNKLV